MDAGTVTPVTAHRTAGEEAQNAMNKTAGFQQSMIDAQCALVADLTVGAAATGVPPAFGPLVWTSNRPQIPPTPDYNARHYYGINRQPVSNSARRVKLNPTGRGSSC